LHSPAALPFRLEEGPAEEARLSATMAHFWNAETERAQPSSSTAATVATSARVSAAVHSGARPERVRRGLVALEELGRGGGGWSPTAAGRGGCGLEGDATRAWTMQELNDKVVVY
jgi:hypothetical protein